MLIPCNGKECSIFNTALSVAYTAHDLFSLLDLDKDCKVTLSRFDNLRSYAYDKGLTTASGGFNGVFGVVQDEKGYGYAQDITRYHVMLLNYLEYYATFQFDFFNRDDAMLLKSRGCFPIKDMLFDCRTGFNLGNCMLRFSKSAIRSCFLLNLIMSEMIYRGVTSEIKLPILELSDDVKIKVVCIYVHNVPVVQSILSKLPFCCSKREHEICFSSLQRASCENLLWGDELLKYGRIQ